MEGISLAESGFQRESHGDWVLVPSSPFCSAYWLRAIIVGYIGWSSASGTDVPVSGYVAMAIGVVFSVAVGAGLMAPSYFTSSSRAGYDELG